MRTESNMLSDHTARDRFASNSYLGTVSTTSQYCPTCFSLSVVVRSSSWPTS